MKRISIAVFLVFLLAALLAQAQMPMPTPAPELKKLNYFAGNWTMEDVTKPGPMGPGGRSTGTGHTEWMEGNFFLTSHGTFDGVMGKGIEVAFMGYNADQKMYTYDSFSSMGEHISSTGSVEGDTWTWSADQPMNGQKIKGRFVMKVLSPTVYNYKLEFSPDGSTWNVVMEGKATRVK